MAAKSSIQRSSRKSDVQESFWRQAILLLAVVPAAVGLLLIATAAFGFIVWDTTREQVVMGGFYILFTFLASNAIQKEWRLVAGWMMLGAAAWLALSRPEIEVKIAAAVLIGLAVALLSGEFFRRRRKYLSEKKR
jgi:hypothetical protein